MAAMAPVERDGIECALLAARLAALERENAELCAQVRDLQQLPRALLALLGDPRIADRTAKLTALALLVEMGARAEGAAPGPWEPEAVEALAAAAGCPPHEVAEHLARLRQWGLVDTGRGAGARLG